MAGWVCADCTAVYSVGAPRCPHCRSTRHVEQGEDLMPKITVHGGPSNAHDPETAGAVTEPPASTAPAPNDEGDASSPGNSSSTSSERSKPSSAPNSSEAPSRARTTGSRSRKAQTDSSSAAGTDGGPTEATSDADA